MIKKYSIPATLILILLAIPIGIQTLNNYQKAVIILDVPDSYEIGELITLDASRSKVDGEIIWKIIPETDNFKITGKIAFFSSSKPIDYTVVVMAKNNRDLNCQVFNLKYNKKEKEKKKEKEIALTPFEEKIVDWIAASNLSTQKTDGLKLAQSYDTIARLIESDIFITVDDIVLATARVTTLALGDNLEDWKPFIINFQRYLETNPPKSLKDHAPIWRNMATALRKVYA